MRRCLIVIIASALFLNCSLFTYFNAIPLIKSDGWRFVKIYLEPWFEGSLTWRSLWDDHHPQPLTAALFIANAHWFSLKMHYESFLSLVFLLLSFFVICRTVLDSLSLTRPWLATVMVSVVALVLFSLTSPQTYNWSLVSKNFIFTFFGIVLVCLAQKGQKYNEYTRLAMFGLGSTLFLLVFTDHAQIYIYSLALVSGVNLAISKDRYWAIMLLAIAVAKGVQVFFINIAVGAGKYNESRALAELLSEIEQWPDYVLYVGYAQASAWMRLDLIEDVTGNDLRVAVIVSIVTLAIYGGTLTLYIIRGLSLQWLMPGVFIIVSLVAASATAVFRFDPSDEKFVVADVPRYYYIYSVGVVGVVWVLALEAARTRWKEVSRYGGAIIVAMIVIGQLASSAVAWERTPYVQKAIVISYERMLRNQQGNLSVRPPKFMLGANYPQPYLDSLDVLYQHKLNLFSGEDFVDRYRR